MKSNAASCFAEEEFNLLTADVGAIAQKVRDYVSRKVPETDYLEFKSGKLQGDELKAKWSKALSAFANSDGGLMIWGVETKFENGVDAAAQLSPVAKPLGLQTRLDQLMHSATNPPVQRVRFVSIEETANSGSGYVVVYIPPSQNRPHRAEWANNHYYLRIGSHSSPMPPNVLRLMFFPVNTTRLRLHAFVTERLTGPGIRTLGVEIHISNEGDRSCRETFVLVEAPTQDVAFLDKTWSTEQGYIGTALTMKRPLHPRGSVFVIQLWTDYAGNGANEEPVVPQDSPAFEVRVRVFCADAPAFVAKTTYSAKELTERARKEAVFEPFPPLKVEFRAPIFDRGL